MSWPWYLFYGYQIGMNRQEILSTSYGEMMDLISCFSVFNGTAEQENVPEDIPMEQILSMR